MRISELYQHFKNSSGVTTDSRNIQQGTIFFALKGANFNGNLFAEEALAKGANFAVVDEQQFAENDKILLVENVLETLQQLALFHRKKFFGKVIALTGSNGKTTTKELVAAVLATNFSTRATKGNLNNHIGIPLTLLSISAETEFAIIEMGANHQKEIESYCKYVEPDFGLITNVGMAHLEGFGGFEGVVKGKTELYRYLSSAGGKIFLNSNNEILSAKAAEAGFSSSDIVTYGTKENSFCHAQLTEGEFLSFSLESQKIHTNLVGNYNFENALAACCIGKYFGVEFQKVKTALENYVPANNRSQQIVKDGNAIILDCYNANPSSMKAAIENFAKSEYTTKVVILGGMKEMGESSASVHAEIAALVKEKHFAQVIFVGKEFGSVDFGKKFETTEAAQTWIANQKFNNVHILVKGSRAYQLEKLF